MQSWSDRFLSWKTVPFQQDDTSGRRLLCASVVLDRAPDQLCERVANQVYEMCRTEKLRVVGFPSFNTVVNAIQTMCPDDSGKEFQVTVRKHDRLVVLQAYAQKWMESEFKDETTSLIEAHNAEFNKDGEFWHEHAERPVHVEKKILFQNTVCKIYPKHSKNMVPKKRFPNTVCTCQESRCWRRSASQADQAGGLWDGQGSWCCYPAEAVSWPSKSANTSHPITSILLYIDYIHSLVESQTPNRAWMAVDWRFNLVINNVAELVVGEQGMPLYLVSRAKNQFLMHREMHLGCTHKQSYRFEIHIYMYVLRCTNSMWVNLVFGFWLPSSIHKTGFQVQLRIRRLASWERDLAFDQTLQSQIIIKTMQWRYIVIYVVCVNNCLRNTVSQNHIPQGSRRSHGGR